MNTLRDRLVQLREVNQLTQCEFAKQVGIAQSLVCRYELGRNLPSVRTLQKIVTTFNLTLDGLIEDPVNELVSDDDIERRFAIKHLIGKLQNPDVTAEMIRALHKFLDVVLVK